MISANAFRGPASAPWRCLPHSGRGAAELPEAFGAMGCRFWIRPVDATGDRKEVFQERQRALWRRFWFRW